MLLQTTLDINLISNENKEKINISFLFFRNFFRLGEKIENSLNENFNGEDVFSNRQIICNLLIELKNIIENEVNNAIGVGINRESFSLSESCDEYTSLKEYVAMLSLSLVGLNLTLAFFMGKINLEQLAEGLNEGMNYEDVEIGTSGQLTVEQFNFEVILENYSSNY